MSAMHAPAEKADIWTVSELTEAIREQLEGAFPEILGQRRGEQPSSPEQRPLFISLSKTAMPRSVAVLFRMGTPPAKTSTCRDGMEVVGFGGFRSMRSGGTYQVIFRLLVDEGVGRLRRAFEALKAKLGEEGLFDAARKRELPRVPLRVGFVTSPTGAALQDFKGILERRGWRGEVWVYPARVQGNGAAEEIAAMIARANAEASCELLIVGRGGGSLEDLWAFNEEVVVRAIAASRIPTVSAVGHEIDIALSDLAADVRAETPSAAAEMISSSFLEYLESVVALREELDRALFDHLRRARERMELWRARAARFHPQMRLQNAALRLDDLCGRLQRQTKVGLDLAMMSSIIVSAHCGKSGRKNACAGCVKRSLLCKMRCALLMSRPLSSGASSFSTARMGVSCASAANSVPARVYGPVSTTEKPIWWFPPASNRPRSPLIRKEIPQKSSLMTFVKIP